MILWEIKIEVSTFNVGYKPLAGRDGNHLINYIRAFICNNRIRRKHRDREEKTEVGGTSLRNRIYDNCYNACFSTILILILKREATLKKLKVRYSLSLKGTLSLT